MTRLPSSQKIVNALLKNGFILISQRGSHQKFRKDDKTVIVPAPSLSFPHVPTHKINENSLSPGAVLSFLAE